MGRKRSNGDNKIKRPKRRKKKEEEEEEEPGVLLGLLCCHSAAETGGHLARSSWRWTETWDRLSRFHSTELSEAPALLPCTSNIQTATCPFEETKTIETLYSPTTTTTLTWFQPLPFVDIYSVLLYGPSPNCDRSLLPKDQQPPPNRKSKMFVFFFVALCSYRKVLNVVSWCGSEWGFPARSNGIRAPLGRKENWRQRQRLFDRARLSVGAEFRPMSKSKIVVLRNDDVRKDSGPRPTAFYAECAGEQVPLCSQTSRALSRRSVIILIFCQSGPSAWKNGGHCLIAVFAFCCCCFFSSWGPGSPIGRNKPLQLQRRSFLTAN